MSCVVENLVLACAISAGCAKQEQPLSCPSGTQAFVVPKRTTNERFCRRTDGQLHGPVVEIDQQGRERKVGQIIDGKKQGRWVSFASSPMKTKSVYRDDQLERFTMFDDPGLVVRHRSWSAGVPHGLWSDANTTGQRVERSFRNGLRTGLWRRFEASGQLIESRMYDHRGLLIARNSRPLAPPPARIELADGATLVLEACLIQKVGELANPCLAAFEAVQVCAGTTEPQRCERDAIATYVPDASHDDPMSF